MTHNTLEHFNQPELFLADVRNLDLRKIPWYSKISALYTRQDGAEVRIMISNDKGYIEDITHPKSPFSYRNNYNEKGDLTFKRASFYGILLYGVYECKNEKCALSTSSEYHPGMKPGVSIEHTRAVLLKETGIDLYDTSTVKRATFFSQDNKHYCYVHTLSSIETLFDAETGKALYRRNILDTDESMASMPGDWEEERSPAYIKSEKIIKDFMKEGDSVYGVFRKIDTRDQARFYEIFIAKPSDTSRIPLVSFLLDHKKRKVIYQLETYMYRMSPEGMPYVDFWNEYEQHLKILEAEEDR